MKNLRKKEMSMLEAGEIIYKTTKPDLSDNLSKGLIDTMQGNVFLNDSQIWKLTTF